MTKFQRLNDTDLMEIEGGVEPISIALGLGTLFVASLKFGYDFGKDLARRGQKP